MPEGRVDRESLLSHARELEKKYDWLGAAETYEKVLGLVPEEDSMRAGDVLERKAYALRKAAFQSDSNDQFRDRISMSIECYREAAESFGKAGVQESAGKRLRGDGMAKYLGFWHASKSEEKKMLVNEAWDLTKKALDSLRESGDAAEFCSTYNQLALASVPVISYLEDHKIQTAIIREVIAYGEHALRCASNLADPSERALTYLRASSFLEWYACEFVDMNEGKRYDSAARDLWDKAKAISEEITFTETATFRDMPSPSDPDEPNRMLKKALEFGEKTNDRLVIGSALDWMAQRQYYGLAEAVDSDELESVAARSYDCCLRAQREYAVVGYLSPDVTWLWAPYPDPWHYAHFSFYVTDPARKREFAEKVLAIEPKLKEIVIGSGYPSVACDSDLIITIALTSLAKTEQIPEKKKRLLEDALRKGAAQQDWWERLHPFHFGSQAFSGNMIADTEFELANLEEDPAFKAQRLGKALLRRRRAVELAEKFLEYPAMQQPKFFAMMGLWQNALGTCALRLFEVSSDKKNLAIAIQSFDDAAESYAKAAQPSRQAESCWSSARAYDTLGEHQKSHERFSQAAAQYGTAAEKLPQLAALYQDHSRYMEVWSQMELARYQHLKQEYVLSGEHYEKTATLLASTERWKFLSTNYSAWSSVEKAEGLSRAENSKEAIDAFREAATLFKDSKSKMQEQLAKIDANDEKQMVERLIDAADRRQELCKARIALEEARLLDKGGNLSSASEKYGLAADMFTKIKQGLTAEQDRKEVELIITLSKAWKAMAKAEAESSPGLYEDAAHLFDEAKNLSPGDKAKNLAIGHSRLCMALGAGARYADAPESTLHAAAVQNLESAAKYYLKANQQSAAEYAKASKLLFDSYAYMNRADSEEDQEKKTRLYTMAEKVLQASASSYYKADQPGKKDQVLKLLAKVQQDKELAISLTEILRAPDVVSTTMAFSSPTPTYETAVGLDRFAHADIQANLIAPKKELKMDEDLILGIELVNAGRGPAQLIKLQDLLPKGFTLREEPGGYRMEDSYLDLRGRRLDPLKTEEINLILKPTHRGQFALKPRILYLDESGKYKSHEPEPIKVSVGIEPMAPADKVVHVDTREAAEARSLLAGLNVVTLSHYRIVGNYVRYGGAVCNALKDARQKIVAACQGSSPKRENYIIWAPPGSGKTYFVQEVAALLGDSVHYRELNLAKLDEAGFRSGLAELRGVQGPGLCLVDEVDAKPNEPWPYEALMPFLDASATEGARLVFVLAGSSGSSVEEMKKAMASRPKGSDILSRVPTDNEYSIPPMGVGDRLLVVLSQFRQAGKQMGHDVREVEKLGLYYVALNPRLSNARQLREFAVRCAERVLPSDDRLKYDSLFHPGDLENKIFWTQALQSASALVGSFLLVED